MKGKIRWSLVLILSQLAASYHIEKLFRGMPFPISVADYVVTSGENWNAGLVLGNLFLFILLHTIKDDFGTTIIVRHTSWSQIAVEQAKRLLFVAIRTSTLSVFSVLVYGWLRGIPWNNWNSGNSYFHFTYGTPVRPILLLEIVINQILSETVIFTIIGLFGLIVLWMNHRAIYAFLILNAIWAMELCLSMRIFHNLLRVRQEMWVEPYWFVIRIGYAGILLLIEIMTLRYLVRHHEHI